MATENWQDDSRFVTEAAKKIFDTYMTGETNNIAVSLALTLLVNTIEQSGQQDIIIPDILITFERYQKLGADGIRQA